MIKMNCCNNSRNVNNNNRDVKMTSNVNNVHQSALLSDVPLAS